MKSKVTKIIIVSLVVIFVAAMAVLAVTKYNSTLYPTKENKLQKVTVSEVTHSVFYAPQYVAQNLGFFKDEGINFASSPAIIAATLSPVLIPYKISESTLLPNTCSTFFWSV